MKETRWQWMAIILVAGGAILACGSTLSMARSLGPAQWGVYAGCVLILVGLFWFRRRLTAGESQLESDRRALQKQRDALSQSEDDFEQLRQQIEAALEDQAADIDRRQRALTSKLANWHEWLEYPEPLDLADVGTDQPRNPTEEDEQLRNLTALDRKLNELLEAESQLLFENIRSNKYVVEGIFQPTILRDDAYVLIEKVARLYVGDKENPLAETSIDQLIRAASRVCMHLLVVLEQLPVKVQHYNLRNLYSWTKQGVKAYGLYRSARPYMPYVNSAYYLSRYAMGSNPYTLLAWWVASEVTSRSASAAAQHLFNQKALALVNDVVRVIGYEVASLYGGDVRHRDANWIYAAELTELASHFPLSREALIHAMKEVGALQLLNEYDRIFLYRCLATGKSAHPGQYNAKSCLHTNERRAVATRLEKYYRGFVTAKDEKQVAIWSASVESRLGMKLKIGREALPPPLEQAKDAVRSLASLLADVKQREGSELSELLQGSAVLTAIPQAEREELLRELAESPPFFFEQPDLDPAAEISRQYLDDLVDLAIATEPHDVPVEPLLEEVAAYLRVSAKQARSLIDRKYIELFNERIASDVSISKATPEIARAFLWICEPAEQVQFVYKNVELQSPDDAPASELPRDKVVLIGTNERLVLLQFGELPLLLWIGDSSIHVKHQPGQLTGSCLLTGGTWLAAPPQQPMPTIIVRSRIHQRFQDYFGPLLRYCQVDSRGNVN